MLEKENPDLYLKIYEPEKLVQNIAELNLSDTATSAAAAGEVTPAVIEKAETEETAEDSEKKHQTRGGKGLLRDESVKLDKEALKRSVNNQS